MTQILAVVAVSVGAFIHGTTVSFPAVAIPSLKSSNNSADLRKPEDAFMPFHVYDHDISLIGIIAPNYSLINSVLFFVTRHMESCENFFTPKLLRRKILCGNFNVFEGFSGLLS